MKNIINILATITFVLSSVAVAYANPSTLFSLENLERERAALLSSLTSTKLSPYQREQQANNIIRRLIDLERMVLRDDRIAASNSIMAKKAFQNYDLTFLVHAGSESKKAPMAHWLSALNITDDSINKSTIGAR